LGRDEKTMMPDLSFRNFKAGSWDLRKRERRQRQDMIEFPDRRRSERRGADLEFDRELTWVDKPGSDE
jgi:hypothetical protein